jgi:adenylate cyclase
MLYLLSKEKKGSDTMSANLYTIENLLVGKSYRSRSVEGEIVSAEKHPKCVWYDGAEAYLVQVRDNLRGNYTYRSIAVKVQD